MTTEYHASIELLENLAHLPFLPARQVGLRRASILLQELGNPHLRFRSVHVAGSSGKGSTTTMIASVLRQAGFRTGCFRSPHLETYTERINVDGVDISEADWSRLFDRVWPVVEAMANSTLPHYELGRPALFDVIFAMTALYFAEQGVEWAAVETGLGGRFDATNVLPSDVAVITTISLEHTRILGDTLAEIAAEKAAIIKPGCTAVSGAHEPEARDVIESRADETGVALIRVPEDVRVRIDHEDVDCIEITAEGPLPLSARLGLAGEFQAHNAAVAVAACHALIGRNVTITGSAVVDGLESARIPGRFEIIRRHPLVILDGAHHPDAAAALARSLEVLATRQRVVILFTALEDKDVESMARFLRPHADQVVITRAPGTSRAAEPRALAAQFGGPTQSVSIVEDPSTALEYTLGQAGDDDVVVVCGSMYLVGLARSHLASAVTR
jgi:dihydrofolate synthase/folylpolyglutamate synthase